MLLSYTVIIFLCFYCEMRTNFTIHFVISVAYKSVYYETTTQYNVVILNSKATHSVSGKIFFDVSIRS